MQHQDDPNKISKVRLGDNGFHPIANTVAFAPVIQDDLISYQPAHRYVAHISSLAQPPYRGSDLVYVKTTFSRREDKQLRLTVANKLVSFSQTACQKTYSRVGNLNPFDPLVLSTADVVSPTIKVSSRLDVFDKTTGVSVPMKDLIAHYTQQKQPGPNNLQLYLENDLIAATSTSSDSAEEEDDDAMPVDDIGPFAPYTGERYYEEEAAEEEEEEIDDANEVIEIDD